MCQEKHIFHESWSKHLSTAADRGGDQTICVTGDAGGSPRSEVASLAQTQGRSWHQLPGTDLGVKGQWGGIRDTAPVTGFLYFNHGQAGDELDPVSFIEALRPCRHVTWGSSLNCWSPSTWLISGEPEPTPRFP